MRIKKIQLKNGYKRFYDLTIDLSDNPKRIIVLVGPNGCGKSSVFDGMLMLNNAYRTIGSKNKRDYSYHSMNCSPGYDHQNINIVFDNDENYSSLWTRFEKLGIEKTIFSFRSSYRYNSNVKINEIKAIPELRLNNYGASTCSDIDDKMEINYRRLSSFYSSYQKKYDAKPSEARAKIIGELNKSVKNCLDLIISDIGDVESNRGTLYFKKNDQPNEFEYNVLSSGEKEVIDILLDLFLRKNEYNDSVYIIDEPELHINTTIQRKLLIEINKMIGADCQIWIATHSIGFLRALQEDLKNQFQIIEFKESVNWGSETQVLTPIKLSCAKWKELFEVAIDDLAGLLSPKRLIYCEGKYQPGKNGEEKGFDAKVYNNIFGEKYSDTLFISSGGNTELDQRSDIAISILTKAISDLEILLLKDRDMSSGKINTEKERQHYLGANLSNHRVLKRWEIENYLFDKQVLIKYCENHDLQFSDAAYDSFVTDIVNQNIKDETGRIKNFCNITTSINPNLFKYELSGYITEDMDLYKELEECIFQRK